MGVNVSNGSLDFVSTLDNSDFQKKSLQDIQLIKLRLELEGDTAGIERYNQAVKNSLSEEITLRKELDKVLKQNQIVPPTPAPAVRTTVFSDSAAEVAAYQASLNGLATGVEIVANLNAQLDDLNFEQDRLTAAFNAGSISEVEYVAATEAVRNEQARLVDNIDRVNQAYTNQAIIQNENVAATTATTAAITEELGVLEALKITLAELKALKLTASASDLPQINRQIQETEAEIQRFSNVGRVGFDQFGQAVEQNVRRGGNALTQGFSYLRKLAYILPGIGVAGIIGFATGPIIEYVANLDILQTKFNQTKQTLDIYTKALASSEYSKAISNVAELTENIKLAKEGFLRKTDVLNEYNKTLGASLGYTDNLNQAEANIIKNGENYIKITLLKASAQLALQEAAKKSFETAQLAAKPLEDFISLKSLGLQFLNAPSIGRFSKEVEEAQKEDRDKQVADTQKQADLELNIFKDFQKKAAELAKKTGIAFFDKPLGTVKDPAVSLLAAQKKLLEDIDALKDKYAAKQTDRDHQELLDINAKFKKQYDDIVAQNVKVQAYLDAHPNKTVAGKKLKIIDPNSILSAQTSAITAQADLNENKFIEEDIEKKKALYADYQEYRLKVGDKIANKDYADLLKSGKDFQTYLSTIQSAVDETNTSAPIQARREFIRKALVDELVQNQQALEKLKIQYASYEQSREALIESSQVKIEALIKAGDQQAANQVKTNLADQLTQLDQQHFQQLDSYRTLFENIDTISTQEAKKQLARLYTYAAVSLATGNITVEAYGKIIKALNEADLKISNKIPEGLKAIGSELQNIGSEVSKFDEGLGKVIETIGGVVSGVGSIKENLNSINSAGSSSFSKITSGLGIFGTAIGIFTSVFSLFDHSKERAEQIAYASELQIKAIQEVNKGLERQLALTKEIYGPDRIAGYLKQLKDVQAAEADTQSKINNKVALTGDKILDDYITKFNNGPVIDFIARDIQKAIESGKAFKLAGQSIEDLQKLLDDGKLDASTAALVQSLVDLQQQAVETQNALNSDLLGTTFDDLAQSIIDLFENATTSAEDFSKNFQKIIQTALLNSFKREFLEKQLQGFYDDFYNATKNAPNNVLTAEDIAKLKAKYDAIVANASEQFKNIQAATGIVFDNSNSSKNSLAGSIQASLTEDTASILAGTLKGIQLGVYDSNKNLIQLTVLAQDILNVALQIQLNTLRTANNSDVLPEMLQQMKGINSNTAGSLDVGLRAAGFYKY
jgi:hypothetical protein